MKKLFAMLLMFCSVSAMAAGTAQLAWDYTAANITAFGVTNFSLERKPGACTAAGTFAEVATPAAALRTYTDPNLTSGLTYCWRIAAVGAGGKSGFSNTVEKVIPFDVPPAPGNLTAVIVISFNHETGLWEIKVGQLGLVDQLGVQ